MVTGKRLAAVDIGTNSIRCLVVEAVEGGGYRLLDDEKATVRLGEGLSATGRISEAAWERACAALKRMHEIAKGLGVIAVEAVATSAVRKAANGEEFVAAMKRQTGIDIQVISGEDEAELAILSARHHFSMGASRYALVDIGGGSAELVLAAGEMVQDVVSMELGAVFLTETFLHQDPVAKSELKDLRKHIRASLRRHCGDMDMQPLQSLIGSGGTITTIGSMIMAQRGESYDSVNRYQVLHSDVVHLSAMLGRLSQNDRRALPGLSPERADIIVAGVVVVEELMHHLGTNILRINEGGIREGLILKGLRKYELIKETGIQNRRLAVEHLARTCQVDMPHAEQTRRIAMKIFDAVNEPYRLYEADRALLEAATILHDIGYFINYSKHHKHSYHLIRHAELFDFSPLEKELIANIARYHRKAMPKAGHENFVRLSPADQRRVMMLGGILRMADGLDRRRAQLLTGLECRMNGSRLAIDLIGGDDLDVEVHSGRVKADLFEKAFGLEVLIRQSTPPAEVS